MERDKTLKGQTGDDVTGLLGEMRLGIAVEKLRAGGRFDRAAVRAMIDDYGRRSEQLIAAGEPGEAKRLARRALALGNLLLCGPDPVRIVAETELPEGYRGKILLVALNGGGFDGAVRLRSGDAWHREILRNTVTELEDLGFPGTRVHPLGGAYARFEAEGGIVLWGSSEAFGRCDKELAAQLIRRAYPSRTVTIDDYR